MNTAYVYYIPDSGEIHSCTNGIATPISGLEIAEIEVPEGTAFTPDKKTQRVDIHTKQLVSKTQEEIIFANEPESASVSDVLFLRAMEFARTDPWMLPDRGLPEGVKAEWAIYRQALRDLTKDENNNPRTARQMVLALPTPPDGYDLQSALRYHLMGRG